MVAAAVTNGSTTARPRSVKMVDLSKQDHIIDQATSVHCEKDVKCWRSLSSVLATLLCGCKLQLEPKIRSSSTNSSSTAAAAAATSPANSDPDTSSFSSKRSSLVTGTIFGHRKGKVVISIQEDPREPPVMLLELAMPTFLLVKEMSSGLLRIALECESSSAAAALGGGKPRQRRHLYAEPVWTMYCNGRKVGFAVRRSMAASDRAVLGMMQSISMGAGVIPVQATAGDHEEPEVDELMYMRATYERVVGSADSESFHMINPDGSPGQELSIFLMRA